MITRLRSALICEEVVGRAGRTDYIGIAGTELLAFNKPGLLEGWFAAQIEVDRRATHGRVRLECEGLLKDFPFAIPAGHPHAGLAFPVYIPVVADGELVATIFDDSTDSATPLRVRWTLGFMPRATRSDLDADQIKAACQASADKIAAQMVN